MTSCYLQCCTWGGGVSIFFANKGGINLKRGGVDVKMGGCHFFITLRFNHIYRPGNLASLGKQSIITVFVHLAETMKQSFVSLS